VVEPSARGENPTVMEIRSFVLAIALVAPCVALAGDVFRWMDEYGRVVYGSEVPERYRGRAEPASAPLPAGTSACEARWHRYLASAACFDQYRVVGGGLKPEAFKRCTEVPQPDPCA
jgi:hypothetical protein